MSERKFIDVDDGDCRSIRLTVVDAVVRIDTSGDHVVMFINDSPVHFNDARWAETAGMRYEVES